MKNNPIVHMILDDECIMKTYLVVIRNTLYIPSNNHNPMSLFLMCDGDVSFVINDEPKIQVCNPAIEHHSIFDDEPQLWIHLYLNTTCSYFGTHSQPTLEVENWNKYEVVWLIPGLPIWDPYGIL